MTLKRVHKLLSWMPYISGVCIMGLCEPLMNPEAPEIIHWLKGHNYAVSLTTNGMVHLSKKLLDATIRVDDLVFSIDTADPGTFSYLRRGADLETVMGNMLRLLQYKRMMGLGRFDKPPVHINAVITSLNLHQIPDLIRMLEPHAGELTYLMVDPISRPDYQRFEEPLMLKQEMLHDSIDKYRKIAKESPLQIIGFDYMLQRSHEWGNCHLSWTAPFIQPNGDVYFCYDYKRVLGNVFQSDLLRIWNGSLARKFRNELRSDLPPVLQCHFCNFARSGWQSGGVYNRTKEDVIEVK